MPENTYRFVVEGSTSPAIASLERLNAVLERQQRIAQAMQQQQQRQAAQQRQATQDRIKSNQRVSDSLDSLRRQQERVGASFQRMGAIGQQSFTGLITKIGAAVASLAILGKTVQSITSGFTESIAAMDQKLMATTAIAKEFNVSRQQAGAIASDVRKAVFTDSLNLPIENKDAQAIASILQRPLAKAYSGDRQRLVEQSAFIAGRSALLQRQLGLHPAQIANALGDFAFASKGELMQQEFFRDLQFESFVREQKFAFDSASAKDRFDFLRKFLDSIVTAEAIAERSKFPDVAFSNFMDSLFDSENGTFGFLRSVKVGNESKTVMESFTDAINNLFGTPDGLFSRVGAALGGTADPLAGVIVAVDQVAGFIKNLSDWFGQLTGSRQVIEGLFTSSLFARGQIGEALASLVNSGLDAIIQNRGIISGIAGVLGREAGSFLVSLNYAKLAGGLASLVADGMFALVTSSTALTTRVASAGAAKLADFVVQALEGIKSIFVSVIRSALQAATERARGVAQFFGLTNQFDAQANRANTEVARMTSSSVALGLSRFKGDPDSFGDRPLPLFEAIRQELRNKPVGSELVIANSTERVFRDDAQALQFYASTLQKANTKPSVSLSVGDLHFHMPQGVTDAKILAKEVIALLEGELIYRLALNA